ncbi:shikimate kinase [Mobilitalea sibirica]|uniref:Shikimate kinase n=1 Tax=Mobilitalea sibirica TaxID=1462919 RepID=A0A8J7H8D9_9FIRM|nr:shikimate kinase [Mobilitalea sibirica]MBH1940190.1 shikimate kinase [Mobilitalea sibirica]
MNKSLKHNIILIGFMGSGKTSVGEHLAKMMNYRFQDTDLLIEQRERDTINQIFRNKGEEYFRDVETNLLTELQNGLNNTVLSTGGGMPLREKNRKLLKELGYVVYLRASKETTVKRLRGDTSRPLLSGEELGEKVKRLLKVRIPYYEKAAHKIIMTDDRSLEEISVLIMEAYLKQIY